MQAAAHCIGLHSNPDQIIALKAVQSLFPADSHTPILRSRRKEICVERNVVFTGGGAFSTVFLDGKNVVKLW
jgi:hypothetical protein